MRWSRLRPVRVPVSAGTAEWARVARARALTASAVRLVPVAIALGVFAVHAALFSDWIIDDAGISFAYARNLALGYGLVSQPDFQPVEGFSNPLWVALLAPFFRLDLFDPVLTPKLLSLLLVAASFVLIYRFMAMAADEARWPIVAGLPLILLAVNTSFVVWTTSGLENPLIVLELAVMLLVAGHAIANERITRVAAVVLGLGAAAAAVTRPDGVLLSLAPAILLLGVRASPRVRLERLTAYAAAFGAPMAAFLGFRLLYFGELLPNTFHAKGGATTDELDIKLSQLRDSVLGFAQPEVQWAVIAAVVAGGLLLFGRPAVRVALLFAISAAAGALLLPPDWMRENRFFSPFIVSFTVLACVELVYLARWTQSAKYRYPALGGVAVAAAVMVASTGWFVDRSITFSRSPTVPMSDVENYFGDRFESYARMLGVERPTILTLDIGGLVYGSDLLVYDLVGLTDKTIALTIHDDQAAFHAYVLDEIKPTFIHTHGLYAVWAAFDTNPRFRAEYRAICEQVDPWVRDVWRFNWYAGDYVRWEVAEDDALVEEMAKQCRNELPYPGN